jgi:hypothetical protein
MALVIYPTASSDNPYSQDGAMTNPIREAFDGRNGGTSETKYYLRNNNILYSYSTIVISLVDSEGRNIVGGVDGYGWKLSSGDTQPTADEWEAITYGASISMSDISDTSTYLPFWVLIEIPRGAPVESHDDVTVRVSAIQTAV